MIVARPRAVPIPLPRMAFGPTRLNLSSQIRVTGWGCEGSLHGGILQHVGYNEKSYHTSPDVHLVEL